MLLIEHMQDLTKFIADGQHLEKPKNDACHDEVLAAANKMATYMDLATRFSLRKFETCT